MDLDTIVGKIFWGSLFAYQFAVRGVHEFDPLYPLLPTADNDLSIFRDGGCFLEFCSSAVQIRRVDVINSVTGFDEAVETCWIYQLTAYVKEEVEQFTIIRHRTNTLLDRGLKTSGHYRSKIS